MGFEAPIATGMVRLSGMPRFASSSAHQQRAELGEALVQLRGRHLHRVHLDDQELPGAALEKGLREHIERLREPGLQRCVLEVVERAAQAHLARRRTCPRRSGGVCAAADTASKSAIHNIPRARIAILPRVTGYRVPARRRGGESHGSSSARNTHRAGRHRLAGRLAVARADGSAAGASRAEDATAHRPRALGGRRARHRAHRRDPRARGASRARGPDHRHEHGLDHRRALRGGLLAGPDGEDRGRHRLGRRVRRLAAAQPAILPAQGGRLQLPHLVEARRQEERDRAALGPRAGPEAEPDPAPPLPARGADSRLRSPARPVPGGLHERGDRRGGRARVRRSRDRDPGEHVAARRVRSGGARGQAAHRRRHLEQHARRSGHPDGSRRPDRGGRGHAARGAGQDHQRRRGREPADLAHGREHDAARARADATRRTS